MLFFIMKAPPQKNTLSSQGELPSPLKEAATIECQKTNLRSCDEFYSAQIILLDLFNGLTKKLGYNNTHSDFFLPTPVENIAEDIITNVHDDQKTNNKNIIFRFINIIETLINIEHPFLSSYEIAQSYAALIPDIDVEIDKEITRQTENYNKWMQYYSDIIFTSVKESFYWTINTEGKPVSNGGTFTFTRNGKSETVQVKNRNNYLTVAYQTFSSDQVPNIYLGAMSRYCSNWIHGGI